MKTVRIILYVLLAVAALIVLRGLGPEQPEGVLPTPATDVLALQESRIPAPPLAEPSPKVEAASEPVEMQQPVQPIEERGDAMLHEIHALQGTPFDQEVTMPFD